MQVIRYPEKEQWSEILKRPVFDNSHLFDIVQKVFDDVRQHGDDAVRKYTAHFDKVHLNHIRYLRVISSEYHTSICGILR